MEFKDKQSIYLQIGDFVCENILLGMWSAGERIPSTREFAVDIQVNPNTVVRTYTHLEELGIIEKKRGIGYFVCQDAVKVIAEYKKKTFLEVHLPEFFKQMELLNISWNEIKLYFDEYKNKL